MEQPIKVIIVDDHRLIRDAVKYLLHLNSQFEVIDVCEDGEQAVAAAKLLNPDIVIMDIDMRPVNGFEATARICKEAPSVKVIGYSNNDELAYARKMMELGAKGYVTKTSHSQELVLAIFKVYAGEEFICREIEDKMHMNL